MHPVGRWIKKGFNALGVDLVRSGHGGIFAGRPASAVRPVGGLPSVLQDIAARGLKVRNILDVGANRGVWSRDAKQVFPDAKFILIEPQIEMKPHLDRFCEESPGSRWVNAGAGANAGSLPMLVAQNDTTSTFMFAGDDGADRSSEIRTVPIVTLDSLYVAAPHAVPEIVKVDVEGFELEVLKGARTLLGRTELFALEAAFFQFFPDAPVFLDIVVAMANYGYSAYDFTWFYRRASDGALALAEVVFARDDGPLRAQKQP